MNLRKVRGLNIHTHERSQVRWKAFYWLGVKVVLTSRWETSWWTLSTPSHCLFITEEQTSSRWLAECYISLKVKGAELWAWKECFQCWTCTHRRVTLGNVLLNWNGKFYWTEKNQPRWTGCNSWGLCVLDRSGGDGENSRRACSSSLWTVSSRLVISSSLLP